MPAMKLTALIVDDDQPARDELVFLLKGFPEVEVVAQGKNGPEAIGIIRELEPQLVFLDVQMPGLDGFGVIKKLLEKKARLPFFIFATAYDNYAVQAFEVNALDYLLKPVARARLEKAIGRTRQMMEAAASTNQKLDRLVQMVEERQPLPAGKANKLLVKSGGGPSPVGSPDLPFAPTQGGGGSAFTPAPPGPSPL